MALKKGRSTFLNVKKKGYEHRYMNFQIIIIITIIIIIIIIIIIKIKYSRIHKCLTLTLRYLLPRTILLKRSIAS